MKVKIFWQENCPKCPEAKKIGKEIGNELKVEYFNVDSVDGLAEASYHDIMTTPSVILVDQFDCEIKSWRGTYPNIKELKKERICIENKNKKNN